MNILCIRLASSINADGFDVKIQDDKDEVITEKSYRYGYTASYSKDWANDEKPYTTDILVNLVNQYKIESLYVSVGKYIFSGKQMQESEADRFISKYILPNSQLSALI